MASRTEKSLVDQALRTTFVGGLSVGSIYGMSVCLVPDPPRYQLPAEVMTGVPWPAGFREEFNAWAQGFLGRANQTLHDLALISLADGLERLERLESARDAGVPQSTVAYENLLAQLSHKGKS